MKKIKILVSLLTTFALVTPVSAATLYDYYIDTQGYFPSVEERKPVAESYGIEDYRGTAKQNTVLLDFLLNVQSMGGDIEPLLGAFNPSGGGTYRLKSSIGTTDTSIALSSFKEPVSNLPYTMSYLNTTIAYGTIDPSTTRSEFISFTGITQNSDGSATLTGVTRGLTRTPAGSSCTASTTFAQRHPGQSVFILSDSPCFFAEYPVKRNDETITGAWSVPTPTAAAHIATKAYVDAQVSGGSPTADKLVVAGTAGETISSGQIIYFDTIQDKWMKASSLVSASSTQALLGIAQGSGTNGVSINGGVLIHGLDETNVGGTVGNLVYLSDTAGATSTTAGTVTKVLGVVRSSSAIYFAPEAYLSNSDFSISGNLTVTENLMVTGTSTLLLPVPIVRTYNFSGSPHTWTKPTGLKYIDVEAWGGGGGGGAGLVGGNNDAGGGGGGAYNKRRIMASDLGATETVTIGAGGAGAAASGGTGTAGGNTTFGSHLTAYGGGGGAGHGNAGPGGGGGGGLLSVGANGTTVGGTGGSPGGGAGGSSSVGGESGFGGGGGGDASFAGGSSAWGGGGGGGNSFAGGASYYGGGGGGGGSTAGVAGGASVFGGAGGAGGDASPLPTAGSVPGGGGGGAFNSASNVAAGAGGNGRVIVIEYYF